MLTQAHTALVVVDIQGKLAGLVQETERLHKNVQTLIRGADILELPILWLEQLPEKLGATSPELDSLLRSLGRKPIVKSSFSGGGSAEFMAKLQASACRQVLLVGIEAHICVYQTALDLRAAGYEVQVVVDAVASRLADNKQLALDKLSRQGVELSSVEMALFELLRLAEGSNFKQISQLLKG